MLYDFTERVVDDGPQEGAWKASAAGLVRRRMNPRTARRDDSEDNGSEEPVAPRMPTG